ncbi:hypothetical protein L9F63_027144, partial [Diploptera punctata]
GVTMTEGARCPSQLCASQPVLLLLFTSNLENYPFEGWMALDLAGERARILSVQDQVLRPFILTFINRTPRTRIDDRLGPLIAVLCANALMSRVRTAFRGQEVFSYCPSGVVLEFGIMPRFFKTLRTMIADPPLVFSRANFRTCGNPRGANTHRSVRVPASCGWWGTQMLPGRARTQGRSNLENVLFEGGMALRLGWASALGSFTFQAMISYIIKSRGPFIDAGCGHNSLLTGGTGIGPGPHVFSSMQDDSRSKAADPALTTGCGAHSLFAVLCSANALCLGVAYSIQRTGGNYGEKYSPLSILRSFLRCKHDSRSRREVVLEFSGIMRIRPRLSNPSARSILKKSRGPCIDDRVWAHLFAVLFAANALMSRQE